MQSKNPPPAFSAFAAEGGQGDEGVLIRAENGDVVTFDATGLTLRLSDTVLADLRQRLGIISQTGILQNATPPNAPQLDPADHLGDIDAWNLRQEGDWLRFTAVLAGAAGTPRDYQRPVKGGDIIAAAPGPLYALLALGGARRADFTQGPAQFRHHVLAPADDIGAVGLEGTAPATPTAGLQHIAHRTRDALTADTLLGWRSATLHGLPLFVVRAETDASAGIAALGTGTAYRNFLTALDTLVATAKTLGKRPRVLAVGLDFSLEDQTSSPAAFAEGMRALMRQIERDMGHRDLQRPHFLATFEAGTQTVSTHPAMLAHWELAWSHGAHSFAFSAPGYMFEQTRFGRPTDAARLRMAEMDAHALVALSNRAPWQCPLFLLAEYQGRDIRVTARAMGDLMLDAALCPEAACGFSLSGTQTPCQITAVRVAADDPQSLILTCDGIPSGFGATLRYAYGARTSPDAFPANRGAVRDQWAAESRSGGGLLHRWALPAVLPLQPGAF